MCDNLKTGVISHPRDGEVVLNDAYRSMAEHYSAAVIPGRVRRPKDKPSAENTVWHATMALAGAMRDRAFASLDELRGAVRGWLDEYNSRPFQKRDGSRRSVFESDERPLLIPLRERRTRWRTGYTAGRCSPTATSRMRATGIPSRTPTPEPSWTCASAPTRSRRGTKGPRLCTHRLLPATAANRYSTNETDLPGKAGWRQWDRERCERWAKHVGPDCADVVGRLFAARRFDDQGVEPALAVLRLSRRYSERRLENACSLALQSVASPRYSTSGRYSRPARDMTGRADGNIR